MVERRSLGAAIGMSPEKRAFIQGGPAVEKTAPSSPTPEPAKVEGSESIPPDHSRSESPARRSRSRRQARTPLPRGDEPLLGIANLLTPLTTRLRPSTAAALKRAGLEQKLRGQSPGTVQDIAEEAIQHWLRDYGYLE